MTTTTHTNSSNGQVRKTLASQLDRLDAILDSLSDGLNQAVATAIERTLQADALVVENEQEVFTAMVALNEGQGSFADALIGALASKAGCVTTVTFDRRASALSGFELL